MKSFFRRLTLREKWLLALFCWVWIAIAANHVFGWLGELRRNWGQASSELENQQMWLDASDQIEEDLLASMQKFNPSLTFNRSRLFGRVDSLARQAGLVSPDVSSPRTQVGDIFELHSMTLSVRRAPIANLIEFDRLLRAESPYLTLQSVRFTADTSDPRLLTAYYIINSFELKENRF